MHKINAGGGARLDVLLKESGLSCQMPCGGKQNCGKCIVFVHAQTDDTSERELAYLASQPPCQYEGFVPRLACFCHVYGECEIILPDEGAENKIVTSGAEDMPDLDYTSKGGLGAAFDIGTTTVALRLYDLHSKKLLYVKGELNKQSSFGADVLSRINASNELGLDAVRAPLAAQLNTMLHDALKASGVSADRVYDIVVTGNTTMLHFVAGLDPRGIGVSPFTPVSLFGSLQTAKSLRTASIFSGLPPDANVYFPPCVGAYVGADITCGLLTLPEKTGCDLFVDVGTNGEMAIIRGGQVTCCATAAGPAFEGAEISMGMTAAPGAIESILMNGECMSVKTIGDVPASGICGTGLISAVAAFIKGGLIDGGGAIECGTDRNGEQAIELGGSGVFITQKDIRAVQLAKAAISAGIETLLRDVPCAERLYLAGGFGSYIRPEEAEAIGLLPRGFAVKTKAVGNSALSGASRLLFSHGERTRAEQLVKQAVEISLSESAYFMDRYIENMMFFEED